MTKRILSIVLVCFIILGLMPVLPANAQTSKWTFNYTGKVENWTAPYNGTYRIEVWGAGGGSTNRGVGGKGAKMSGEIELTAGTQLKICVGQKGESTTSAWRGAGGGGASGVIKADDTPLIIAAGGGGAGYWDDLYDRVDGGNGSAAITDDRSGGSAGTRYGRYEVPGAGGGGFAGNGSDPTVRTDYDNVKPRGGKSYINGRSGGVGFRGEGGAGGFGCGGGGGGGNGGGGGGGMKGGRGGDASNSFDGDRIEYLGGSGGISYNSLSNQSNSSGVRIGNGSVIITLLSISNAPTIIAPVPGTKHQKPTITASFPGSVNFHWQYSTDGSNFYDITTTNSTTYEWSIPESIPDGADIHLRVRAEVNSVVSPWSVPVVFIKGIDDLLGARLAAEAAFQAANEAKAIATETKETVQILAQDISQNMYQLGQRLMNIEDIIKRMGANSIQLSWDNNKTATTNSGEWLNISAVVTDTQYRYRVNDGTYSEWNSFSNRVYIELGSNPGYKNVNIQFGDEYGNLLADKRIGIWKL